MTGMDHLTSCLNLGELLDAVRALYGGYELIAHWKQGEFHHDLVLRVHEPRALPGAILVASTNCNGGLKELSCFAEVPEREAIWHERCPNGDFDARPLPPLLARQRTLHWFDPCELLGRNARSELKPEHRKRQRGGGWEPTYG
jgi:hypothetical protein